jgi:hypothetical protein
MPYNIQASQSVKFRPVYTQRTSLNLVKLLNCNYIAVHNRCYSALKGVWLTTRKNRKDIEKRFAQPLDMFFSDMARSIHSGGAQPFRRPPDPRDDSPPTLLIQKGVFHISHLMPRTNNNPTVESGHPSLNPLLFRSYSAAGRGAE